MRARWIPVVTAVALVLAACTSGGSGKSGSPTSTTASSATDVGAKKSTGCRSAAEAPPGEEKVTLTSGGAERWYFRHVPPAYDASKPVPVVLDLHGYSEGAVVHTQMSGLGPFGDTHGFVTITPQGQGPVARWDTALGSTDLTFVGDLLDHVESTLCVDTSRVFVTGLSNGAFMTSAVACAYADRIAAAAPVAGIRDIEGCKPKRKVPVVAFHGTADGFVAFDGGLGDKVASLPAPDGSGKTLGESGLLPASEAKGPSIPDIVAAWAERNGCARKPSERTVAADVARVAYDCPTGADVQLYRVQGGGHTWPGSAFSVAVESVVGHTTMSISADEIMWAFFEAHPLRTAA